MRRRQTRAGVAKGALDERARACSRCGNPSEQGERSLPAARSLAASCAARCTRGWCWGAGVRRRGRATRLAAGSVPSSDGARASAAGRSARRDRPVQREFAGALQPRMGQRGADGAPAARSLRDGRPPADVWVLERARLPWRACLLGDTKGGTRRLGMLHSCRVTGGMAARPSVVLQHSVCRTLRNVDANGQCRTRRGSRPGYPTSPEVFTRGLHQTSPRQSARAPSRWCCRVERAGARRHGPRRHASVDDTHGPRTRRHLDDEE